MFLILADMKLVRFFKMFYYFAGPVGLLLGIIVAFAVLIVSCSKSGAKILFLVFLVLSLFQSAMLGEGATAIMAAVTVMRYSLLFPIAVWGIIWLFSKNRRLGLVGILLFLHCLLYLPVILQNAGQGWERWAALFMMWFALVGTISGWVHDIEDVKKFLATLGIISWFVILILGGYAVLFPGRAMFGGRLASFLYRPNALAIDMFFCIMAVGYRALYVKPNKYKVIDFTAMGVAIIMLIMTGTRAGGFAAVPVIIMLIRGRTKSYMVMGVFFILLILGIVWSIPWVNAIILERFLGVTAELTTTGRFEMWVAQWPIALQKPLFGHGINYVDITLPTNPHNSFLVIAIEGGFINAAMFILAFVVGLGGAFFRSFGLSSGIDRRTAHLILAAVAGVAFICFFESVGSGIGGAGITVIWMLLQLTEGVRPAQESQWYGSDDYDYEYDNSEDDYELPYAEANADLF